ncbi:hypothetical protein NW759_016716 [Fusarium solani]|nr:hypothetical protein NW759_016716 [Fusarium solani]
MLGTPFGEENDYLFLSESPSTAPTPSRTSSSTPGPPSPYDYPRKSPPVAQQLAELKIDDTRHITIDTLPRLRISAKTYVLYSWLWHRNKLRSSVVENGHFLVEVIDNTAGDTFWLCKYYDARGRG